MSWASSEWKNGLPSTAIQKINELETLVERLQKERQQRLLHVDTLEQTLEKTRRKQDEEIHSLKREIQTLVDGNVLAEKEKHKIHQDLLARDQVIISLQKQLDTTAKQKARNSEGRLDAQHSGDHEYNILKKKILELENYLSKQQLLIKQFEEKAKESQKAIEPDEAEITITELKRECEILRCTNSRLEISLKKAETDINRADGDKAVEKLGEENLKLKQELDHALCKLHDCEQKIKLLDCQKHNAEAARNSLEQKAKEKENDLLESFKEQIQDLENQLKEHQDELEKTRKSLQKAEAANRELEEELKLLKFTYRNANNSEQCKKLVEQLSMKDQKIADLELQLKEARQHMELNQLSPGGAKAWSDDVNELQQKLLETERKVENMTIDAEDLKEAMETLEFEKLELEEAREVTAAENQKLVNELKSMKLECSNLREELTEFNKHSFHDISTDISEYISEIEALKLNKEEANQKIKELEAILIEAKEENEMLLAQLSTEKNNLKSAVCERDLLLQKLRDSISLQEFPERDETQSDLLKLQTDREKMLGLEAILDKLKSENETLASKCTNLQAASTDIMDTLENEYKSKEMLQNQLGQMSIETIEKYKEVIAERDFLKQELANKNETLTDIEQKLFEATMQQQQYLEEKRQLQVRCDELDVTVQKLDGTLQKEKDDLKAKLEIRWKTIIENIQIKNTELLEEKEVGCQKLKDELQTLKAQMAELNESTILVLEEEIKKLKLENEALQNQLSKAEEDFKQLISEKETLLEAVNEHKGKVEEMQTEIFELSNHLIAATVDKEVEKEKATSYENDYELLSNEKDELFEKFELLEKECNEMKSEKEQRLVEIDQLKLSEVMLKENLEKVHLEQGEISNSLNEIEVKYREVESRKSSLEKLLSESQDKIQDLQTQITSLTSEVQIAKTDKDLLNSLQVEITNLSEKNKELMLQLQEMTDNNTALQTEMTSLQTKNNEMEESFKNTKSELELKKEQVEETTAKVTELLKEREELKMQNDLLNKQLEEVQVTIENLQKEKEELENKLKEEEERLENLDKEIEKYNAEKEIEKGKLDALEKEVKDLEGEKCNLATALDNKEKDILKIQEESKLSYAEIEKAYEKLKVEYEELLQNLRLSENETKKLMTEKMDMTECLEKQQAEVSEMQKELAALQDQLATAAAIKDGDKKTIEQLENELKLVSSEKNEALEKSEKQEEEYELLLQKTQNLEKENLRILSDKETLQAKIESLITENETLNQEKNDTVSQLTGQEQKINSLQEELKNITCQLNEAKKMKGEIESLQKKLGDLSSELGDLTTKHQQKEVQLTIVLSEKDYFEKQTSELEKQMEALKSMQDSFDKEHRSLVEENQKMVEELALLRMQAAQHSVTEENIKEKLAENPELPQHTSDYFKLELNLGKDAYSKYSPDNKLTGSTFESVNINSNSVVKDAELAAVSTNIFSPTYSYNFDCEHKFETEVGSESLFPLITSESRCPNLNLNDCNTLHVDNLRSDFSLHIDSEQSVVPYSFETENFDVLRFSESEISDSLATSIQNLLQYLKQISHEDPLFGSSAQEKEILTGYSNNIDREVALEKFQNFDGSNSSFRNYIINLIIAISRILQSRMDQNKNKQQKGETTENRQMDSKAFETILASKDNFIFELKKSLDLHEKTIKSKEEELSKKQNSIKNLQATIDELEEYMEDNMQEKTNLQNVCLSLEKLFERYCSTANILKQPTSIDIELDKKQMAAVAFPPSVEMNITNSTDGEDNLPAKVQKLEDDLKAANESVTSLQLQLNTLRIYYEKCLEEAQQRYDLSHRDLTEELKQKAIEIKEKDSDLKNSQLTLKDTNSLLSKYEVKLENLKCQLKSARDELKLKENENKLLKHSSDEINLCYENLMEKSKNDMNALNLKLEKSEGAYKKQLETAEQNYKELYNNFMKDIQQKDSKIDLLQEEVKSLELKFSENQLNDCDAQIKNLESNLKVATEDLVMKENELKTLQQFNKDTKESYEAEIEQLNVDLHSTKKETEILSSANAALKKDLEEVNQRCIKLSEDIKSKDAEIVLFQEKVALAESSLEDSRVLTNSYQLKQQDLILQLDSTNILLKEAKEELQQWKDEVEKSKVSFDEDIAKLKSDLQLSQNKIEMLTSELETSDLTHKEYVQKANEDYEAVITKFKSELQNKDSEIKLLSEKINLLDSDSTEVGHLLNEYKIKIDEINAELSLTSEQLKERENEVNILKDSMKSLEESRGTSLEKLTIDLQVSEKEVESLKLRLQTVNADYETYVREATEKQITLTDNFNEEIRMRNETTETLQEKLKSLETTNKSLIENELKLEAITTELNSTKDQLQIKEKEVESLKLSAEELKVNYDKVITDLKDSIQKSEQKMADRDKTIESSVSDYEKQVKDAEQKCNELEQKFSEQLKEKDSKLEELDEKMKFSESNVEKLNIELGEYQKDLEKSKSEISEIMNKLGQKENEVATLTQSIEELKQEYEVTISKLKEDMKSTEEIQTEKLQSSVSNYKKLLEEAQVNCQNLQEKLTEEVKQRQSESELLREKADALNDCQEKFEQTTLKLLEKETEIEDMKRSSEETIQCHEATVAELQKDLQIVKDKMEELKQDYEMTINKLKEDIKCTEEAQTEQLQSSVSNYKKLLEEAEVNCRELQEKLTEEIKQRQLESELLREKTDALNDCQEKFEQTTLKLLEKETEIEDLKRSSEEMIQSHEATVAELQKDLQITKDKMEELKQEYEMTINKLKEDIKSSEDGIEVQNEKFQSSLSNYKKLLEEAEVNSQNLQEKLTGEIKQRQLDSELLKEKMDALNDCQEKLEQTTLKLLEKETEIEDLKNSSEEMIPRHEATVAELQKDLQIIKDKKEELKQDYEMTINKLKEDMKSTEEAQTEKLQSSVSNYKKLLEEAEVKCRELQEKLMEEIKQRQLESEILKEKTDVLNDCQEKFEQTTLKLLEKETEIEDLKSSNEEMMQRHEATVAELQKDLQIIKDEMEEKNKKFQNSTIEYEKSLEKAEQEYKELQQRLVEEVKQKDVNLEELDEKIKFSESNLQNLNTTLSECQRDLEKSKSEVNTLVNKLKVKDEEVATLKQSLQEIEQNYDVTVDKLKADVKSLEEGIEVQSKKLQSSVSNYEKLLEEAEANYQDLQGKLSEEVKQRQSHLELLKEKTTALNDCQVKFEQTTLKLLEKEQDIEKLKWSGEEAVKNYDATIAKLQKDLQNVKDEMEEQNKKFQNSSADCKKHLEKAKQDYEELQRKFADKMKENETKVDLLTEKIKLSENNSEKLTVSLSECQKSLESSRSEIATITDQLQLKESEIELLKQSIENMTRDYENSLSKLQLDKKSLEEEIEASNKNFHSTKANYEKCIEEAEQSYQELNRKLLQETEERRIQSELLKNTKQSSQEMELRFTEEIKLKTQQIMALEEKARILESNSGESSLALSNYEEQTRNLQDEVNCITEKLNVKENKVKELEELVTNLSLQLKDTIEKMQSVENYCASELQKGFEALQQTESKLNRVVSQTGKLATFAGESITKMKSLAVKDLEINRLNNLISDLEEWKSAKESMITNCKSRMFKNITQMNELRDQMNEVLMLSEDNWGSEEDLAAMEQHEDDTCWMNKVEDCCEKQLNSLKSSIAKLSEKLKIAAELAHQAESSEAEMKNLKEEIERLTAELDLKEKKIEEISQMIVEKDNENEKLSTAVKESQDDVSNLKNKIKLLLSNSRRLEKDKLDLENELIEMQNLVPKGNTVPSSKVTEIGSSLRLMEMTEKKPPLPKAPKRRETTTSAKNESDKASKEPISQRARKVNVKPELPTLKEETQIEKENCIQVTAEKKLSQRTKENPPIQSKAETIETKKRKDRPSSESATLPNQIQPLAASNPESTTNKVTTENDATPRKKDKRPRQEVQIGDCKVQ